MVLFRRIAQALQDERDVGIGGVAVVLVEKRFPPRHGAGRSGAAIARKHDRAVLIALTEDWRQALRISLTQSDEC